MVVIDLRFFERAFLLRVFHQQTIGGGLLRPHIIPCNWNEWWEALVRRQSFLDWRALCDNMIALSSAPI